MSAAIRRLIGVLLALVGAFALPRDAGAINADPRPAEFTQPDGSKVELYLRGDEWMHWQEDTHGYPVLPVAGWWRYAQHDASGDLVATPYAVGKIDPASQGLETGGPRLNAEGRAQRVAFERAMQTAAAQSTPPTGTVKNLVVLCLFSDQSVAANGRDPAAYDSLFNQANSTGFNAPTGSVRDYYQQASYGQLTINSTVIAWVTLPHTQAYYANNLYGLPFASPGKSASPYPTNACGMIHDALNLVDPIVNFHDFDANGDGYVDAIDFIHSGYGGEQNGNGPNTIWSHKSNLSSTNGGGVWTSNDPSSGGGNVKVDLYHTEPARWGTAGSELVRVGVIAHETGHFFGLPDLYDLDGSSSGIGSFCLMSNSWGFDGSQHFPPLPSAWCRIRLGWLTPDVATVPGNFQVREVELYQDVIRIDHNMPPNEYLLVENRQPIGFDVGIPQGGLAIWHIDDNVSGNQNEGYPGQSGWPSNGNHYQVALLQADGKYDLEKNANQGDAGDLWQNVPGIALSEVTSPSTDDYQSSYSVPTGNEISQIPASSSYMTFYYRPATWADFAFGGPIHLGNYLDPYNSVADAVANTPDQGIVMCRASTSGEHPSLSHPMLFKSYGGISTLGRP